MAVPPALLAAAEKLLPANWHVIYFFTESSFASLPSKTPPLSDHDKTTLRTTLQSRESAIRNGIHVADLVFAVHQFETVANIALAYGRRGDAVSGSGACAFSAAMPHGTLFGVAIYSFPYVSANAVPAVIQLLTSLPSASSIPSEPSTTTPPAI